VSVVVIGLNHRIAPLEILERTSVDGASLPKALDDLCARANITEAVLLSTCNRTEVYVVAERFHGAYSDVRDFIAHHAGLRPDELTYHLYSHFDEGAASHLFAVAAGLDSAVLGESEILGQVRDAWEVAKGHGTARSTLNALFRQALEVGKRVRTETGLSRHTTSVSMAAVAMAGEHLGGLAGRRVLVLGAGDIGEGMAVALADAGVGEVLVANRTFDRADGLATRLGGRPVRLLELAEALTGVDVLLTSTGARSILVEHADLAPVMDARRDRPLLVVDVAVPRDVDPGVASIPGVTLLDIDDLRTFADKGVAERRREVPAAQAIVEEEVGRWLDHSTAREVAPLITALREWAEDLRAGELDRAKARLDDLSPREREAVEAITRGIVAKLLHEPTVRLKEVAGTARGERLSEALRDLFAL
jgi:glutamyl-tRNA reductase